MRRLLPFFALLLLLGACDDAGPAVETGGEAPAFTATHLDGRTVSFPADFAGKPVAVRFWADWCAFCRQEMTDIEPIYLAHKKDGLAVLAVNVGQDRKTAADFMESLGVTYDGLLDEDSEIAGTYRVVGLPTTFFVDRGGIVRGKILGESDAKVFRDMVGRIVKAAE